ncbi:tetratricopeptide repeat protein [Amycolatopsis sp. NPDC049691]|uniref:tetratricopeptide repeat protein n=1 Tax=Amycolatopsis sp. NPDC049691 TaxID=3155155 RepID=UPI00342D0D55
MDAGRLTLQDLIKRRQAGGFVGRRDEISRFEENLRLPLDDQRRRFLFSVHGDAGVGKSFLVTQFQRIAGERGCATAYVDESVYDIPSVLSGIVRAFARQGDPCKEFTKKSELYHEKRHELDADPATPDGLSSVLTRSAVRIGLRAAEDIPVVGSFAKELDRDALSNQVEKFRAFLSVKLRNQHDVRLLMSPVEELTPIFVNELREVAAKRPVVLFFDTFERTGVFLERWLLDLLDGRYGSLPPNLVLVLAGQHPLDVHAWGGYLGIRADCPLQVFTEEEAREFLAARGVTAEEVVEVVLALSGRLPVLLALLAESRPDSAASVADPGDNAVERFLKWEKDEKRKQAALRGALPRQLDRDVFALVADAATPDEDFAWLRRLPFVTERATGYRYHDVVRDTMIRTLRRRSPAEWRDRHGALAEYFRSACDALGLAEDDRLPDERWQVLAVEQHYHRLCAGATGAVPDVLAALVSTVEKRPDQAGRWVAMVRQAGSDSGTEQLTALGTRLAGAAGDGDEGSVSLLTCLAGEAALPGDSVLDAYRELARLSMRQSDTAGAIAAYTSVIERLPDAGWAIEGRALAHRLANQYDQAIADLDRALELDPDSASAYGQRGRTWRAMNRDEEALADFCRALELDPAARDIYRARGATYHSMERYSEALADFDRALEFAPDNTWLIGQRGRAYYSLERFAEALADFTRVIDVDPQADWAFADRGEVYHAMERHEEALADFTRAIEVDPEYVWALGQRGRTYGDLRRYAEAFADYERALEINPESVWILGCRAKTHREAGHTEEALADFARALDIEPAADWILASRAEMHRRMGRHDDALAGFGRALDIDPGYVWARAMRARTYRSMGRYAEALDELTRAVESDPKVAWIIGDRAETLRMMGRFEEALAEYERAVTVKPEYEWAQVQRMLVLCDLRREDDALAELTRTVDRDPRPAWAWTARGEVHHLLGRYEEALADFSRATEADPRSADAYGHRGCTRRYLKQYDEALADFDRAVAIDDDSGWLWSVRGQALRILGRLSEARTDLERAADLDGEAWDQYQLGLLACVEGRPETADELFARAVKLESAGGEHGRHHTGAAFNLMTYHLALGAVETAETRLREALRLKPAQGQIRDTVEDLEELASLMPVPERFATTLRAEL